METPLPEADEDPASSIAEAGAEAAEAAFTTASMVDMTPDVLTTLTTASEDRKRSSSRARGRLPPPSRAGEVEEEERGRESAFASSSEAPRTRSATNSGSSTFRRPK